MNYRWIVILVVLACSIQMASAEGANASALGVLHFNDSIGSSIVDSYNSSMIWSMVNSKVDINTTQVRFGNASIWAAPTGFFTTSTGDVLLRQRFAMDWWMCSPFLQTGSYSIIASGTGATDGYIYPVDSRSYGYMRPGNVLSCTWSGVYPGIWNHFVLQTNGTYASCYMNGTLSSSGAYIGKAFTSPSFTFGGYAGVGYFNGFMDEMRFSSAPVYGKLSYYTVPTSPYGEALLPPVSAFSSNITTSFTTPFAVNFTDSSLRANTWNWSINTSPTSWDTFNFTGFNPPERNIVYTFPSRGIYVVNLTVSNSDSPTVTDSSSHYIFGNNSLVADFNGTPRYAHPYTAVNFVDMSTGDSLYNWTWDFGDKNTSFVRNPYNTYGALGTKNVNLTTKGSDGQSSINKTAYIRINWNNTFTLTVRDATSFNIIYEPLTIVLTQAGVVYATYTTTSGTVPIELPDGTYEVLVQAVPNVYASNLANVVMVGTDTVGTIYLTPTITTAQQTWYTPWQVHYKLMDQNTNPIINTTVTMFYISSTLPSTSTSWLVTAFGVSSSVAADMTNSSIAMMGTTDSGGDIDFTLFKNIKYSINIWNQTNNINYTVSGYPTQQEYIYTIPIGVYAAPTLGNNLISYSLRTVTVDAGNETVMMSYNDATGYTTSLTFAVYNASNTLVYSTSYSGAAANSQIYSQIVQHSIRGDVMTYGIFASQSQYGWINVTNTTTFDSQIALIGNAPGWVELWLSVGFIVIFAAVFSVFSIQFAMIVVPLLAWYFQFVMHWYDIGLGGVGLYGMIFVIGVISYIRKAEEKIN